MTREHAGILAAGGDLHGAVELLMEAAQRTPFDKAHIDELIRLARSTDDRQRLFDVLTRLQGILSGDEERLVVLRELAPLAQELGDRGRRGGALRGDRPAGSHRHVHAVEVVEQDASDRGDHAAVAALLARRIEAAPLPDTRRALRLRRAALLEQRLGLLDEACAELEALLAASPDDVSALRFLADIHERLGTPLARRPALVQAGRSRDDHRRAGRVRPPRVQQLPRRRGRRVREGHAGERRSHRAARGRDRAPRRDRPPGGDGHALAAALDQLASASRDAPSGAQLLVEAARATSMLGDDATALERARRAVKLAPESPDAVLEARRIEYRLRGTGTPRDAQAAVEELGRIAPRLRPAHVDLHAFLLAETLDVIQGHGAGMRELTRRHAEVGPSTLVALGTGGAPGPEAELLAALPLFDRALGGDLQGMRARGRVALAAAENRSERRRSSQAAARLLEEAAAEPETRTLALRRQLELHGCAR